MLKVPGGAGAIVGGMCINACCSNKSRGRDVVAAALVSEGGPPTSSTKIAAEVIYSGYQASSCFLNDGNSVVVDAVA